MKRAESTATSRAATFSPCTQSSAASKAASRRTSPFDCCGVNPSAAARSAMSRVFLFAPPRFRPAGRSQLTPPWCVYKRLFERRCVSLFLTRKQLPSGEGARQARPPGSASLRRSQPRRSRHAPRAHFNAYSSACTLHEVTSSGLSSHQSRESRLTHDPSGSCRTISLSASSLRQLCR